MKYAPILLLELIYKPIWLAAVALPIFLKGLFPFFVVVTSVIFVTFIVGDLIAIPFALLFQKKE